MSTKKDIDGKDVDAGDYVWVYCQVYATDRGGMPGELERASNMIVNVVAPDGVGNTTQLNLHSKQVHKHNG